MSLNICCDIQMVGPELVLNNIRWGIFSKHTAYLSIVVPHFYPLIMKAHQSSYGYFKHVTKPKLCLFLLNMTKSSL